VRSGAVSHVFPQGQAGSPSIENYGGKAAAAFPRSFAKVQRLARVVIEEQFVGFIC